MRSSCIIDPSLAPSVLLSFTQPVLSVHQYCFLFCFVFLPVLAFFSSPNRHGLAKHYKSWQYFPICCPMSSPIYCKCKQRFPPRAVSNLPPHDQQTHWRNNKIQKTERCGSCCTRVKDRTMARRTDGRNYPQKGWWKRYTAQNCVWTYNSYLDR